MSTLTENTTEVLNDLLQINNDRIEGYTRAQKESRDNAADLIGLFQQMVQQSETCASELRSMITKYGGEVATGSTTMGKIYRAWMDLKITFSGNDRRTVLASCEFGEDAAQKAYKAALDESDVDDEARILISTQKGQLRNSHDLIKKMRDAEAAKAS